MPKNAMSTWTFTPVGIRLGRFATMAVGPGQCDGSRKQMRWMAPAHGI